MEDKTVTLSVRLEPSKLTPDYRCHLLSMLREKYTDRCIRDLGYVFDISDIVILSNSIQNEDGSVLFSVDASCSIMMPHIGQELDTVVDMIFAHGLFVSYRKIMQVLVPFHKLTEKQYVFKTGFGSCSYASPSHTIHIHDPIRVRLTDFRFHKDHYACIGELI